VVFPQGYLMVRHSFFDALSRFLHPRPRERPLSADDRQFLERFEQIVEQQACTREFTTAAAADAMGLSRMHLSRKLQVLVGRTTHDYILARRLEIARTLLTQPLPVRFVANSVGFRSCSHFAKAFRKKFEVTPSTFQARQSLDWQSMEKNGDRQSGNKDKRKAGS
jgi:AraC-like DNA-binding protein